MAKRILLVMTDTTLREGECAAAGTARLARESGGTVRMMYTGPLPPPRVDRYDRVIADTDREMARLGAVAEDRLDRIARAMGDVPVERVVRFGGLGREVAIEAAVFGADLVVLAVPPRPGFRDKARAWYIHRVALASKMRVTVGGRGPAPCPEAKEAVGPAKPALERESYRTA